MTVVHSHRRSKALTRKPHSASITDTIARQVCSPAVAQKLSALGVPQESLWYWVASRRKKYPLLMTVEELSEAPLFQTVAVSAFTVGELGVLLPSTIEQEGEFLGFLCSKSFRGFSVAYALAPTEKPNRVEIKAVSEADARAQMLIYLIENNLYIP